MIYCNIVRIESKNTNSQVLPKYLDKIIAHIRIITRYINCKYPVLICSKASLIIFQQTSDKNNDLTSTLLLKNSTWFETYKQKPSRFDLVKTAKKKPKRHQADLAKPHTQRTLSQLHNFKRKMFKKCVILMVSVLKTWKNCKFNCFLHYKTNNLSWILP